MKAHSVIPFAFLSQIVTRKFPESYHLQCWPLPCCPLLLREMMYWNVNQQILSHINKTCLEVSGKSLFAKFPYDVPSMSVVSVLIANTCLGNWKHILSGCFLSLKVSYPITQNAKWFVLGHIYDYIHKTLWPRLTWVHYRRYCGA